MKIEIYLIILIITLFILITIFRGIEEALFIFTIIILSKLKKWKQKEN